MSGMQLTTTSPSSSNSRRSTPWVLGCCGPMLSSIVSPSSARPETRCLSSSTVASICVRPIGCPFGSLPRVRLAAVDLVEVEGELDLFIALRLVLPQRMSHPVVGHQNPAQIRMAGEGDSEKVEEFPLVPVGGGKHRLEAGELGGIPFETRVQPQKDVVGKAVEAVQDREAGFGRPSIAGRQGGQGVEFGFGS